MKEILPASIGLILLYAHIGCSAIVGSRLEPLDAGGDGDVSDGTADADEDGPRDVDGEEARECARREDCDDDDICNGEETCDTDTHRCVPGIKLPDGEACGEGPRKICLDGTCAESICGDAYVDDGNGEQCEGETAETCATACGTTGERRCEDCSWTSCNAPRETCNGRDDDCDDACDEDFECCASLGRSCTTECGSTGLQHCSSSCAWGDCVPPGEICNGLDDDCDGYVDEDSDYAIVGEILVITSEYSTSTDPSLAFTGSEFGVVWNDTRDGNHEVYFARVSLDGEKIGSDVRMTFDTGTSTRQSLAFSGSVFGLAWQDMRSASGMNVYFTRISTTGDKLDGDIQISSEDDSLGARYPDIAATESGFGMAWVRNGPRDLHLTRLSRGGAILGSSIVAPDGVARNLWAVPSLVYTGTGFGVSWVDESNENKELYFAAMGNTGTLVTSPVRVTFEGNSWMPSLVYASGEYGLAWLDDRDGNGEIYVVRLDEDGAKVGTDTRVTEDEAASTFPSAAYSGYEYAIAWVDERDLNPELYFTRLAGDGTKMGGDARLTATAGNSESPSLLYTGSEYAMAWHDRIDSWINIHFAKIGCPE
ncbi:MAG: hypothetical protein ABIJ56_21040 [Pseudomonadota bacterium]